MPLDRQTLTSDAMFLGSGALATRTGLRTFIELDAIQGEFTLWCDQQPNQREAWQSAWLRFWPAYQAQKQAPTTLGTLAAVLDAQAHATQAQITKEQLEAESKTKQRPRKAQGPPCGLFAQTQGQLF